MTFYKALNGYKPANGGTGRYPGIGRWTRHLNPDQLLACAYGYHLAKDQQILGWLTPTIFVAEPCPDHPPLDAEDKWVTCRVRLIRKTGWDERTARLFAADCAETVVHLIPAERRQPFTTVIDVARRHANGDATDEELAAAGAAAGLAAWAAAVTINGAAAGAAAGHAARAAAWDAAWDAAGRAARAAARHAAWDAAWAAARAAQYVLFLKAIGDTT